MMPDPFRRALWIAGFVLGGYLFTRHWLDFEPAIALIFAISLAMMGFALASGGGKGNQNGPGQDPGSGD